MKGGDRAEAIARVEEMHRRYAGLIYDHCLRILGDRSEAEDAVQETFVSAFRFLGTYRYGASPLPWLYRIATNASLRLIRAGKRTLPDNRVESRADEGADPVLKIHARRVLERLVDDLDERGLNILVSHYLGGMSQGQIAEAMGISRRAVVKRLGALRRKLGHLFEEEANHG
jgi:RNA polymerase sigma-70 factor (ECF subfamily)